MIRKETSLSCQGRSRRVVNDFEQAKRGKESLLTEFTIPISNAAMLAQMTADANRGRFSRAFT